MIKLESLSYDLGKDPTVARAQARLMDYLRRPAVERASRRAPFDEAVLRQEHIIQAVARRSFGKCAFCEMDPLGVESVDHFRPLDAARDLRGRAHRDYYAWLAYEADNLILVCNECAYHKSSLFPLASERAPFMASLVEIRRLERPLLIDPIYDEPSKHLDFRLNGVCVPRDKRGKVTVDILQLNREHLLELRAHAMRQTLEELRSAIYSPAADREFISLFAPSRSYAGARLSLLRRLLKGVRLDGRALSTSVNESAFHLGLALGPDMTQADREKLLRRLDQLERLDARGGPVPQTYRETDEETEPGRAWARKRQAFTGGIASFAIENFKGVEHLELQLEAGRRRHAAPCLMLLGENAVGKSSILQAIALALIGAKAARALNLQPTDILRRRFDQDLNQVPVTDARAYVKFDRALPARFELEADTQLVAEAEQSRAVVLGYGPRRFFDRTKSRRAQTPHGRVHTLFSPAATIPYPGAWLSQLDDDRFNEVAQIIRIVLSVGDDDDLVRSPTGQICLRLDDREVPLDWLSDGYRSVFVMVADIVRQLSAHFRYLKEAEAVVLIDEIETHLHPRWKMSIMPALRRALPQVQFIVTTHDPLCLRGMEDGEVVVLQRTAGGRIAPLENLPSIKGMRADQILTSDYFGLFSTSDPEAELDLARHVRALRDGADGVSPRAQTLIKHIAIGDDAQEQLLQRAMRQYIEAREKPVGELRPDVSEDAFRAVVAALRGNGRG